MNIRLIIDTDAYSGNFEQELAEFCTLPIRDKVQEVPNDEYPGVMYLSEMWPTPGRFNDGMGNHWDEGADEAEVRAKRGATVMQCVRDEHAREMYIRNGPGHYPAYESVAIRFVGITEGELEAVKQRAREFAAKPSGYIKPFRIRGFRVEETGK